MAFGITINVKTKINRSRQPEILKGFAVILGNIYIFAQTKLTTQMSSVENANATRHYTLLIISIVIGLVCLYFLFLVDSFMYTSISNVILVIGSIICLTAVFRIMK